MGGLNGGLLKRIELEGKKRVSNGRFMFRCKVGALVFSKQKGCGEQNREWVTDDKKVLGDSKGENIFKEPASRADI